jgi:hypothetical protein
MPDRNPHQRDDDVPIDFTAAASSSTRPAPPSDTLAEAIAAVRARHPQPATPPAVHGRRAAGFVQLNLTVRPDVKRRLKALADREGVAMAELLDELLDRHLPPA